MIGAIVNKVHAKVKRRRLARLNLALQSAIQAFDWTKSVYLANECWRLQGKHIRASLVDGTNGVFKITHGSGGDAVYVTSLSRSDRLYAQGFVARANQLAKSYAIEKIAFGDQDIVVDCGANYGDLALYLNSLDVPLRYIAIEPSPVDFECLRLNLHNSRLDARLENVALSDAVGSLEFFIDRERASSSLFEPPTYSEKISIRSETLDLFCARMGIAGEPIKLLKLEAEGAEPEICRGMERTLRDVCYIAADLGPERGVGEECTASEVINFLLARGFEVMEFGDRFSLRILFVNKGMKRVGLD